MAHFITTNKEISQPDFFQFRSKRIIDLKPDHMYANFRHKTEIIESMKNIEDEEEKEKEKRICNRFIKVKFGKINGKEKDEIEKENQIAIMKDYQNIKKKWKKNRKELSFEIRCNRKLPTDIDQFMGSEKVERINLQKVLREMPQNVEIFHKYYQKAANSYANIFETYEIVKSKEKHKEWYNETYNNSAKSTNFKRMQKVLNSLDKNKNEKKKFSDFGIRKINTQESFYSRKSDIPTFELRTFNSGIEEMSINRRKNRFGISSS